MTRSLRLISMLVVLLMLAAACGQKEGVHQGRQVGFAPGAGGDVGGGGGGEDFGDEFIDADGDGFADEGTFTDDFGDGGEVAGLDPVEGDTGGGDTGGDTGGGDAGTGGGGGGGDAGTGGGGSAPPSGGGGGSTPPSGGGGSAPPSGGGGGGGGGSAPPSGGGGGGGGGGSAPAGPNDRVGVTDSAIRIGVHAPLSGAAPLPQASFETGKDQYWRAVGPVAGRTVQVIVRDDTFNPSTATRVCNQMIQQDQVFILVGGGGADQIAACARTAAQQGVPYLSAGVDEGPLRQLPNYFALSMSYVQQAPLIAQYIASNRRPEDGRVAIVRDRTPSYNNVVARLQQELQGKGLQSEVIQFSSAAGTAQAVSRFQTAFVIMSPSQFVQLVRSPGGNSPHWVGVGITMGLNTVANAACAGGNNYRGDFLSPFPGLNAIDSLDSGFRQAGGQDDIQLALWGLNKTIHEVFKKLGNDIGRAAFVNALETNEIRTNVYPALRHRPDNHFGANTAHLLQVNCSRGQYETPSGGTFVSSF